MVYTLATYIESMSTELRKRYTVLYISNCGVYTLAAYIESMSTELRKRYTGDYDERSLELCWAHPPVTRRGYREQVRVVRGLQYS